MNVADYVSVLHEFQKEHAEFNVRNIDDRNTILNFAKKYKLTIEFFLFPINDLELLDTDDIWSICNVCSIAICQKFKQIQRK